MKKAVIAFSSLSFFVLFIFILGAMLSKHETYACEEWKAQSKQYSGFFLAQWQADQCEAHNIIINAPVK